MKEIRQGKLIIRVNETAMVKPAQETLHRRLWLSNMDLVMGYYHMPSVYFYQRPVGAKKFFFDAEILKDALSRVLVPFYPLAGRLARDETGRRTEIDCNGEGVLFVVAETDSTIEDLGDFAPGIQLMQLIPKVEYTDDNIPVYPLVVLQVTHFKCGGVSLGVGIVHKVADGCSGTHFINSWADMARGLKVAVLPSIDRTPLRARDPPTPSFPHVEMHPPPSLKAPVTTTVAVTVNVFKLSQAQLNHLKSKLNASPSKTQSYSSYVTVATHIWRCACIARGLSPDQLTKMHCAIDGRKRLRPPLPDGYLGNVVFQATPIASAGETAKGEGSIAAEKIRAALARMDDEYLRSTLDYIEVQKDLRKVSRGPHSFKCPNIGVTSWIQMPIHDADFGWGKPVYMGPGAILYEGLAFVLPSPIGDGSLSVAISLQEDHMIRFRELFYEF